MVPSDILSGEGFVIRIVRPSVETSVAVSVVVLIIRLANSLAICSSVS